MTLTFNLTVYSNLLAEFTPKVIETEQEYEQTLSLVEQLTFNPNRTPEETELHKLLVILIEAYEAEFYPIQEPQPSQILHHIMESSGTSPEDLVSILGSSEVVSEVLNGQRTISLYQAKILADLFKVSPSLFISNSLD
ncbi:transcriptional regulator [Spirulina sp. CS-785/01]|uniref:helix-turn-helix domain-containing protein n=1 Tax=Spirulina sp. CS-785/01 TaxID=3021716 RepID=UPI00232CE992|nr:transcriptional regulator [Spirulina sp. CS-785/01]MDB9312366.1 transcriptional regulator [Spirulina sp. CS-785/01]